MLLAEKVVSSVSEEAREDVKQVLLESGVPAGAVEDAITRILNSITEICEKEIKRVCSACNAQLSFHI